MTQELKALPAPDKIYLQVEGESFGDCEGQTWSVDRINDTDIEYRKSSDFVAIEAQVAELTTYADKLAEGFPVGMLPKDIEVIKQANVNLAQEVADMHSRLKEVAKWMENETSIHAALLGGEDRDIVNWMGGMNTAITKLRSAFPEVLHE